MRVSWRLVVGMVLPLSVAQAAPRALQTVIVTPKAAHLTLANPGISRADRAANLMAEAKASQARLLADLAPMTAGGQDAKVTEVSPLWLVNRVVVTATPEVIAQLVKRADVQEVRATKKIELIAIGRSGAISGSP